jgi:hypothetical protein
MIEARIFGTGRTRLAGRTASLDLPGVRIQIDKLDAQTF